MIIYSFYLFSVSDKWKALICEDIIVLTAKYLYTQRRVQPDQCYITVQITGSNFDCSL